MVERPAGSEPDLVDTAMRVETPEHVAFEFRLAGPWLRAGAWLLDLLLRAGLLLLAVMLLAVAGVVFSGVPDLVEAHAGLVLLAWFAIEWLYYVLFEWLWDGRTPGKRALHLRVVGEGGHPVGLQESALRNLLRAADMLPPAHPFGLPLLVPTYLTGVLVCAADARGRRLGDLVAGTVVVVEEPALLRSAARVEPPPRPGELEALPARPRLAAEEKRTLDAFMRRWRRISPARRDEICATWARALARRLGVAEPAAPARFLQLVYAKLSEETRPPPAGRAP